MLDYDDYVVGALVEEGLVEPDAVEAAARHAAEQRVSTSEALIAAGAVSTRQVAMVRATISECPFVDLGDYDIDIHLASRLPRSVAERCAAFPLFDLEDVVTVGMADPLDLKAVDQLRTHLRADVEPVLCEPDALRELIGRAYSLTGARRDEPERPAAAVEDPAAAEEPIVAAVNQILGGAIDEGASDVHIGPDEHALHLRYRIDGSLQQRQGPSLAAHPGVVQRIKVMANLDLTQTRRPQDGKFRYTHKARSVDVRVSVVPTVYGENVVMRLLASGASIRGFEELALSAEDTRRFERHISQPHGMLLVTGPTGSGKTTTLYTAVKHINSPDLNIMTIEDPVEIRLPMVRQIQVNAQIGMTFAGALRSILRQDPDVVLVGEIRDEETARIAVQAALTGHLVFTTLHANDAPGAIARLLDFGCPPFAVNASVLCAMAQRLVRRVCADCARPCEAEPVLAERFGIPAHEPGLVRGAGCHRCSGTGYRGRAGVFELLQMTHGMQRVVERSRSISQVRRQARLDGMRPMWADGLDKARIGLTTLEEVARAVAVELIEEDAQDARDPPDDVRLSA